MKLKIILQIYFILILAITNSYAEPPFTHIKDLHKITPLEYPHLSVINGFVWWSKGIVENMYRLGDKEHSTIKLLWNLFHLQHDDVTFDITNIDKNPAKYFSIQTIGKIFTIVERYSYSKILAPDTQVTLFNELFNSIANDLNIEKIIENSKAKIEKIKNKAAKEFPNYKKYLKITEINDEISINKQLLNERNISKAEKTKLYESITKSKREIKQLGSKSKLSKDPNVKSVLKTIHAATISEENLKNTVNILVNALNESLQGKYPPFTFHQTLLAFVWQKANSRKDLIPFYNQLQKSHPKTINEAALLALKTEQTPLQYTKEEAETFNQALNNVEINPNFADKNYEKIIFSLFSYEFYNNTMPPMIKSISDAIFKDPDGKAHSFSDCGSTSLRNFINILSYDFNKKMCDIYRLGKKSEDKLKVQKEPNEISLTINPKLQNFYRSKKHKDIKHIQDRPAHSAWAQVTSGLRGVKYLTPKKNSICEIGLGLSNMLKVINHLFFNNSLLFDSMTNSEKLNLIAANLSNDHFILNWKSASDVDNKIYDNKIVINFTLKSTSSNSIQEFTWHFEPKHFFIIVKKQDETKNGLQEKFHLPVLQDFRAIQAIQLISIMNIMAMSSTVSNSKAISLAEPKYSFLYFCSLSKQDRNKLIQKDKILPQLEQLYTYEGYLEFLKNQFEYLSPRTSKKFIEHIIEEKKTKYYQLALAYPSGKIQDKKIVLYKNILLSGIKKYYHHLDEFFEGVSFKTNKVELAEIIFSKKIKELFQPAENFVSNALTSIGTKEEMKVSLIELAILYKLTSVYESIKKEFNKLKKAKQKAIKDLIHKNKIESLYGLKIKDPKSEMENIGFFAQKPKRLGATGRIQQRRRSPFSRTPLRPRHSNIDPLRQSQLRRGEVRREAG